MPLKNPKLTAKGLEYEILFFFKEDSSRQVFKALRKDPVSGLEQEVLVKMLLEDCLSEEFESLSEVRSPFCVRLLGFENFGKKPALILEYIKGVSLFQLMDHFELTKEEIHQIIASIYKGLLDLSSYGLCHGDLSLNNVLIDQSGQVKLIDFGRANYEQSTYGTAPFTAPEVLKGFQPNLLSDLYALGVVEALLKRRHPLSKLANISPEDLNDSSPLLALDPLKRSFSIADKNSKIKEAEDIKLSAKAKDSLSLKVKELIFVTESRRLPTLKHVFSKPKNNFKSVFANYMILLFFCVFLGSHSHKGRSSYGAIKVYTNGWLFLESRQFKSYTPFHALLEEGWYKMKWKGKEAEGTKKIFVSAGKTLVLNDKSFQIQ